MGRNILKLLPWYVLGGSLGSLVLYRWAKGRGLIRPPHAVIPTAIPSSSRVPSSEVSWALKAAADATGVPIELLRAVALVESAYNPRAVSRAGAMGLMQLMPSTARRYNVTDPYDPRQSALGGARVLKNLYERYNNWTQALAAYNWGPGNVRKKPKYQQWPPKVRRYIAKVRQHWGVSAA
jgi:soluble lytic murein transglycosylase-like protein